MKVPSNEAEPSRAPNGYIPPQTELNTRCSHGEHAELDAAGGGQMHPNGTSHASTSAHEPAQSPAEAAEAAVYGEVGSYATDTRAQAARHADSIAWNNLRAAHLGYDPPIDDAGSEGPSGTVRWVRNAIQRSWGAWLVGDSSPGAWQMCRQQAATPADAVFLDALRGHRRLGDGGGHVPLGADGGMVDGSAVASVTGSSGGEWAAPPGGSGTGSAAMESAMLSRRSLRHRMDSEPLDWGSMEHLREHDAAGGPLDAGGHGSSGSGGAAAAEAGRCNTQGDAVLPNILGIDELRLPEARAGNSNLIENLREHEGIANLAVEANHALRRLGAVVDDDYRLEEDEQEGSDEDADVEAAEYTHAYEWGRGGGRGSRQSLPRQSAGPELLSYIYGHVRVFQKLPPTCVVSSFHSYSLLLMGFLDSG